MTHPPTPLLRRLRGKLRFLKWRYRVYIEPFRQRWAEIRCPGHEWSKGILLSPTRRVRVCLVCFAIRRYIKLYNPITGEGEKHWPKFPPRPRKRTREKGETP